MSEPAILRSTGDRTGAEPIDLGLGMSAANHCAGIVMVMGSALNAH